METRKKSPPPYKKLNKGSSPSPATRQPAPRGVERTKTQPAPAAGKPRTASQTMHLKQGNGSYPLQRTGHILTLLLMVLIILGLAFLIFLFLRPGRVQIWQRGETGAPVIERLEPEEEPVVAVREEALEDTGAPTNPEKQDSQEIPRVRDMKIYFVKVNTEGQISLKSTVRGIDFSSAPLTECIASLIQGPGSDEINKGSLSLIPEGTRLLSARVEEGTAYLNFNEAFRFNPLGREGYLAQLKQVVYSATEFQNIGNVQILIEGVVRDYLGGEGFYIGTPLNRDSFQNTP